MARYRIETKGEKQEYAKAVFDRLVDEYQLPGHRSSAFLKVTPKGWREGSFYLTGDGDLKVRFHRRERGLEVITDSLTREQILAVLE